MPGPKTPAAALFGISVPCTVTVPGPLHAASAPIGKAVTASTPAVLVVVVVVIFFIGPVLSMADWCPSHGGRAKPSPGVLGIGGLSAPPSGETAASIYYGSVSVALSRSVSSIPIVRQRAKDAAEHLALRESLPGLTSRPVDDALAG